jgi:hypothetical protein
MVKVVSIEWQGDFRLRFVFSDGTEGVHDLADLVREEGPMVEPLRDQGYFRRVFLGDSAPTWPNGFDLSPGWLRQEVEKAGGLTRAATE